MKCKDCDKCVWFGDYALHYCGITKDMVEPVFDCHCPDEYNKITPSRSVVRRTNVQTGKSVNEGLK